MARRLLLAPLAWGWRGGTAGSWWHARTAEHVVLAKRRGAVSGRTRQGLAAGSVNTARRVGGCGNRAMLGLFRGGRVRNLADVSPWSIQSVVARGAGWSILGEVKTHLAEKENG